MQILFIIHDVRIMPTPFPRNLYLRIQYVTVHCIPVSNPVEVFVSLPEDAGREAGNARNNQKFSDKAGR